MAKGSESCIPGTRLGDPPSFQRTIIMPSLYIYLSNYISISLSIFQYLYLFLSFYIYISFYLFVICLSFSIYLSIYLSLKGEYVIFWPFLVNNSICKNDILTKVTFPKPAQKNLNMSITQKVFILAPIPKLL